MSLRKKLRSARHSTAKTCKVNGVSQVTTYLRIYDLSCGHEVAALAGCVPKHCSECGRRVVES